MERWGRRLSGYLDVPYTDVEYALATPCPTATNSSIGNLSLQDLYNRASHDLFAMANQATSLPPLTCSTAPATPIINLVANAEGGNPVITPNTWVEIIGLNLAPTGDSRTWQGSDFVNNQMPTKLDGVSVKVNGESAYVGYISPTQMNILTPPDAMKGMVAVQVTNHGVARPSFTVQAQPISPSFFVFNGGPYVVGQHADGSLHRPGQSLSRTNHSGRARRGSGAICQRFRADVHTGGQRIECPIRNSFPSACCHYRRGRGGRAICGIDFARLVPVQRCGSNASSGRRQHTDGNLWWRACHADCADYYTSPRAATHDANFLCGAERQRFLERHAPRSEFRQY